MSIALGIINGITAVLVVSTFRNVRRTRHYRRVAAVIASGQLDELIDAGGDPLDPMYRPLVLELHRKMGSA